MSYFCHDCGTVIEEDDTNLCGKCAKKQHPTPMTNPAVEALKPCPFCGSEPKRIFAAMHNNYVECPECHCSTPHGFVSMSGADLVWNRRAQAEQTPVAGRLISEEFHEWIMRNLAALEQRVRREGLHAWSMEIVSRAEALRAAPSETVRREGE